MNPRNIKNYVEFDIPTSRYIPIPTYIYRILHFLSQQSDYVSQFDIENNTHSDEEEYLFRIALSQLDTSMYIDHKKMYKCASGYNYYVDCYKITQKGIDYYNDLKVKE